MTHTVVIREDESILKTSKLNDMVEEITTLKENLARIRNAFSELISTNERLWAENYNLSNQVETLEDYLLSEENVVPVTEFNEEEIDDLKNTIHLLNDRIYASDMKYDSRDRKLDQDVKDILSYFLDEFTKVNQE